MSDDALVVKFEDLKRRRDAVMLERAREETRLETINKEIEGLLLSLKDYGVTDEESARALLEKTTIAIDRDLLELEDALKAYDSARGATSDA